MFDTMIGLLMELKAYQMFVDWMKDKAGPHARDLEGVLVSSRLEVASEPEIQSKLRTIAEGVLQQGEDNLAQALAEALQKWHPKGKVN